jgi:hypothetical protein
MSIKNVKTCVGTPHIHSNPLSSQQLSLSLSLSLVSASRTETGSNRYSSQHLSFLSLLIIEHPSLSQRTACNEANDESL